MYLIMQCRHNSSHYYSKGLHKKIKHIIIIIVRKVCVKNFNYTSYRLTMLTFDLTYTAGYTDQAAKMGRSCYIEKSI